MRGANLTGSILIEANFDHANLLHAKLVRANLEAAVLRGVNFLDGDLTDANLTNADLTSSNPEAASSLKNARLFGVRGLTDEQLQACVARGGITVDLRGRGPKFTDDASTLKFTDDVSTLKFTDEANLSERQPHTQGATPSQSAPFVLETPHHASPEAGLDETP
jgi:hypothetical protein